MASTLLSFNNYYYRRGGAEVIFQEHNRMLEAQGWDIVPFAMKHPNNDQSPWGEYFVDEIEFGSDYNWTQKLTRVPRVIYSNDARRKLTKLLDVVRPDIAHGHNIYHHISPSILPLLKQRGIPLLLTLHDLKLACPAYKMFTHNHICERCKGGNLYNVLRYRCIKDSVPLSSLIMIESSMHRLLGLYDYVDHFISPSRFYIDKFVEWGWDRQRFKHIPNFVDVDLLQPSYEFSNEYVYVGRLAPEKGLHTLIKAVARAGVKLRLVGSGPEEGNLKALAEQEKAMVEFDGYQKGEALYRLIQNARATVIPSEWYENAPVSIMESYALGTPVIGANIGGIAELVRHEETGLLFESGNVDSLVESLSQFASIPDKSVVEMGHVGRQWVVDDFSASRYVVRIIDLYDQLLSAR